MLWILIGVFAGSVMPVQTVANTRLSRSTGTPFSSSMISFLVGFIALLVVLVVLNGAQMKLGQASGEPWWIWMGGVLGVVALTGNILMFPRLGAVQTVVLPILGQIIMGLIIDNFGLFGSLKEPVSLTRVVGAAVVMAGVLLIVLKSTGAGKAVASGEKKEEARRRANASEWLWRAFGVLCGLLLAAQAAINGHLGKVIAGPIAAAIVSFFVGLVVLIGINAAQKWKPQVPAPEGESNPWWMWIGGILGAIFVLLNAMLVPHIGTGLTVVAVLSGLMLGSVVVERARGENVTGRQLLGLLVIFAGVLIVDFL